MTNQTNTSQNNGRNHVAGFALMLESIGHDFTESALALYEKNKETAGHGTYFTSINLLATQAIEILAKSLIAFHICLENNNRTVVEIENVINKKFLSLLHNLDNIFNEIPELKKSVNILNIKKVNKELYPGVLVDEFRLNIDDEKQTQIRIKSLEAARYGIFSRNKDLGITSLQDIEDIAVFLKKLQQETRLLRVKMIEKFDKEQKAN